MYPPRNPRIEIKIDEYPIITFIAMITIVLAPLLALIRAKMFGG